MLTKSAIVMWIERTGEFVIICKEEDTIKRVLHFPNWDDAQNIIRAWVTS